MFQILVIDWRDWGIEQMEVYCAQGSKTEKNQQWAFIIYIYIYIYIYILYMCVCVFVCVSCSVVSDSL